MESNIDCFAALNLILCNDVPLVHHYLRSLSEVIGHLMLLLLLVIFGLVQERTVYIYVVYCR
jgi:hypothetical protein